MADVNRNSSKGEAWPSDWPPPELYEEAAARDEHPPEKQPCRFAPRSFR